MCSSPDVNEEPDDVYPEVRFEEALWCVLNAALRESTGAYAAIVIPKFGLDFGIFIRDATQCCQIFVEAKAYGGQRPGGIGFGNGRGEGPQVEVLLSDQLDIFNENIRWAFADGTKPAGADRYALLNCSEAKAAVMGTVAKGKQNNFRMSAVQPHFVSWQVFVQKLRAFVARAQRCAV